MESRQTRSSLQVTLSVWRALLLREATARLSAKRAAWAWILLEPVMHVVFLMVLMSVVRVRHFAGVEVELFVLISVVGFFVAKNAAVKGSGAIDANAGLFAYRQVLPVDTVIVRAAMEGILMLMCGLLLMGLMGLLGYEVVPDNLAMVLLVLLCLWGLGLGLALILSVLRELVSEIASMAEMLFRPLYLASAVVYPLMAIPQPYRDILLLNPFAHALELLRAGFVPHLGTAPGVSLIYLALWSLALVMLGLALQLRFSSRLIAE